MYKINLRRDTKGNFLFLCNIEFKLVERNRAQLPQFKDAAAAFSRRT